jgi:hypothetical protein
MHARSFLVEILCPNSNSKDTPFICAPSRYPQGRLVSVQSGHWVKRYTSPFYEYPKGWTRPWGTGKTLISTIQNNWQYFSRLQSKLQLFRTHPSPFCKDKQCNPLRLVIESPWSMTWPSIFCKYGLGADVSGTDPLGPQALPKDTQFYFCSNVTSMFIQHLNLGP